MDVDADGKSGELPRACQKGPEEHYGDQPLSD